MIGLRSWAVVGLLVLLCGWASAGEPDQAKNLLAKLKASLEAVETVQGTYRTYFSPKTPGSTNSIEPEGHPVPGAIAGPNDLVLFSEFDWAWQAAPYREAIDGKWGYVDENQMHYTPAAFFFDGATVRTFNRDARGGLVKPLDNTFTVWRNPLHLVGIGFGIEPRRNLDKLLDGAELISLPDAPPHLEVLRSSFRDNGPDLQLTVWIDPTHGYLPCRIEVLEKARRFVTWRIVNERIEEVAPSVWMALRGSETGYYVADVTLPAGMSKDRLQKPDRWAVAALMTNARVIAGTLGLGTQTYIVDPRTLRLNQVIPRAICSELSGGSPPLRHDSRSAPAIRVQDQPDARGVAGNRCQGRTRGKGGSRSPCCPAELDRQARSGFPGGFRLDQQQADPACGPGRESGHPGLLG